MAEARVDPIRTSRPRLEELMTASRPAVGPLVLSPALQHYAWGDPGFIPRALGLAGTDAPVAEAWYGAHPLAPATAATDAGEVPLDRLLAAAGPAFLGPELATRFDHLPYLLKLLSAARPLSIQVHPSREQAAAGFARDEAAGVPRSAPDRRYRDPHHKPELIVALTSFDALCGFRPPRAIAATLDGLPELRPLLPHFDPADGPDGVRDLLAAWFAVPAAAAAPALQKLVDRLAIEDARAPLSSRTPAHWALRAHRELDAGGAPDHGLLLVFLLELLHLEPGEALFLPAGVPHAYLHGAGVEIMASSDNVLRAGLTPKLVDTAELLQVVRFDAGRPPVLAPLPTDDGVESLYPAPAAEFDLRRLRLGAGQTVTRTAHGPETLLVLAAADGTAPATVTVIVEGQDAALALAGGQAALIPHGARYRLTAAGPATVFRARVPGGEDPGTFRGRAPTRLAFGTSGLRGLVDDITDLEAYVNARGFLDFLVAGSAAVPGTPVAMAGDLRPSTHGPGRSIARAVARAILDAGLRPVWCGPIPTPALTHLGLQRRWPSIMVTGSHIPFDRNGIKFNRPDGEVLKSDESAILAAVARVRRQQYACRPELSMFDDDGWLRTPFVPELPATTDAARALYVRRYLDAFPADALAGLRLAFYEHSAVGRELVPEILRGLGAEVIPVGRSAGFVAIDTEALTAERLAALQDLADRVQAEHGRIDAVVSTDGDSDRPLLLGVAADGTLEFMGGDVLGAVVADALGADAIAVPVSSNDLIDRHFGARGVAVQRTRIGSPWVIAAMAAMDGARRVGWEANGGFLTGSALTIDGGGELAALPTRDAVLPLVAALHAARTRGVAPGELVAALPPRFSRAGLLDAVDPAASRALLQRFGVGEPGVRRVRFADDQVRWTDHDGADHAADPTLAGRWLEIRDALAAHLTADRGFGPPEEVDVLDGLRVRCASGDVVHVRPSGNAPQLRIYATADTPARAEEIVALGLREPDGLLRELLAATAAFRFEAAIRHNIAATDRLFASGEPPQVIGTVSGSAAAQAFWQRQLDAARPALGAREAHSLHEDLPVNQAFGLLLLWQRLRPHLRAGDGALVAFVFGEGTRATPWTEAECGQKPAIISPTRVTEDGRRRALTTVELALRTFAPVEAHLRRSGFEGLVVKWGDEVQIPTCDLTGRDPRFDGADVVRFVSLREMTAETAAGKDWVGVAPDGRITAFIPRRPLTEMEPLADRGLIQRRDGKLHGGVNLGSIALSSALLDVLLQEFQEEVGDPDADRKRRPDLDPQLFTALCIAAMDRPAERERAWGRARRESAAMRKLEQDLPGVLPRLVSALDRFAARHGRPVKMVAMDFGDQYWGDIGQHRQMHDLYLALRGHGPAGRIARALAGLEGEFDRHGNLLCGDTVLGPGVTVRDSVLVDARIDAGEIAGSVLLGTRCGTLVAREAFDLESTAVALDLAPRSGSYKVVGEAAVTAGPGERVTTVFLPDGEELLRVHEDTDLRDRAANYDQPILGNRIAFGAAHAAVTAADPADLERRRERRRQEVAAKLGG